MTTFALIPGAGCAPSYWRLLAAELRARGHEPLPIDLPCEDPDADFDTYADTVITALGDRRDVVIVAHSFGAFTGMLVCERRPPRLLVLLAGMLPRHGETAADWWTSTGHKEAHAQLAERLGFATDDFDELFYSDVPAAIVAEEKREPPRSQSDAPSRAPWPLASPPATPTRFLLFRDDHLFPADFMRRLCHDRLGLPADEMEGGHMAMLSRPAALADRLVAYLVE